MWEDFFVIGCWVIFTLLWLIFLIVFSVKDNKQKKEYSNKSYYGGLYVTGIITIVLYITEFSKIDIVFPYQKMLGVILVAFGLSFAIIARMRLKNCWSFHACANNDFRIEKRFPYNIVRHPIYLGQSLMCLGTAFVTSNIGIFLIFFVGTFIQNYYRAIKEERLINKITKGEYEKEFSKKGRFIPKL